MSRLDDRRVVEVLRLFDKAAVHPNGSATYFMHAICTTSDNCFNDWDAAAVRNVLVAFLVGCPDSWLDEMLSEAQEELASCARYLADDIQRENKLQAEAN